MERTLTGPSMIGKTAESESFRIRREWAKRAVQHFRFRFPEAAARLYEGQDNFFVLVETEQIRFNEMQDEFEGSIRPVTCPVRLVREIDASAVPVDEDRPYSEELWLGGEPLNTPAMNALLHLSAPNLPVGGVDFNHALDCWAFMSPRELSDDEKERVGTAMLQMSLAGPIQFQVFEPQPPKPLGLDFETSKKSDMLVVSGSFVHSQAARHLVARDEDVWRNFLGHRISGVPEPAPTIPTEFSCLFDMSDRSEIRLSELLTIYDRIDIIPDRQNSDWLNKHGLDVDDLMQLVAMGRCRVILPYGAEHCRPDILDGLASIDARPPILSRELAARTFRSGKSKDPLLYGAFTAKQRSTVLTAIQALSSHTSLKTLSASYGQMFARQHHAFMMNGAMASMNFGVGAHLAEMFANTRGLDARIELSSAGACVEWAMALGSSWIPRSFGGGYDETRNSHLVASFMSRTIGTPVGPVASRMHTLTDSLLAVSGVPPLEIARNFKGASIARFRALARRLMQQAPTQTEMQECVEQINQETRRFERRVERLSAWRLDSVAAAIVAKPMGDAIDEQLGYWASTIAGLLLEALKGHIPSKIAGPVAEIREVMLGLALAPSVDAVVVSRARSQLPRKSFS
jgi:hypothetical protein